MRRLVVFDCAPADAAGRADVKRVLRAMADDGWVLVRDWAAPAPSQRTVCTGTITDADAARRALLAALAGAAIVAVAIAERPVIDGFVDDLRRLGPVEHLTPGTRLSPALDAEQRALLGLLADGLTLGEAAAQLGLSRRTADRRLSAARQALGVATTTQAIVALRR